MTAHTEMQIPDERRDKLAEKVMEIMLGKDGEWSGDPKTLAWRAYAVADAMISLGLRK